MPGPDQARRAADPGGRRPRKLVGPGHPGHPLQARSPVHALRRADLDFARDWSWYVSYAEVYQPQADRQTWNSEPLSPVEGKTYETGIKGELADGRLNLSLAAFRIDLENNPQEDPDHPGPPNNPFYISGGKVRSQGFELEGTGYLTPYWSLSAGYTYTSTEYLKDSQNDSGTRYSTFTPRHLLRLWSNYDLPCRIGAGASAADSRRRATTASTTAA